VRQGGRYDGAYGTVAGLLLAASRLGAAGLPVVGFVTCEEEDSRFHGGMMGARSLLGLVEPAELDDVRDRAGVSWRQALARARARGCASPVPAQGPPRAPLFRPGAMLELHIEQGPVLAAEKLALGLVERIAGYQRWRATIHGEARHAGTTPMLLRHDALVAAAEIALEAETAAREMGEPAVATAGFVRADPGLFNVVAGACELWLEARHAESGALATLAGDLERRAAIVANRRDVALTMERLASQAPQALSIALADRAAEVATTLGVRHRRMTSGAAHDAMVVARTGVPTLMLFVPSQGGISHSPDEHTSEADLFTGLSVALDLVRRIATQPEPIGR